MFNQKYTVAISFTLFLVTDLVKGVGKEILAER
jgi:hypothetical protein